MPRIERAKVVHPDLGPHAAVKRWCVLVAVVIMAGVMARVEMQAQTPAPRPASTVQQLMQAILFPNANVIFATESDDPAAVPRDAKPSASTNPLSGLYGGWQAVENSSLALLESADLLNLAAVPVPTAGRYRSTNHSGKRPWRRCANRHARRPQRHARAARSKSARPTSSWPTLAAAATGSIAGQRITVRVDVSLEHSQECHEILLFLGQELQSEHQVEKLHGVVKRQQPIIVEERW